MITTALESGNATAALPVHTAAATRAAATHPPAGAHAAGWQLALIVGGLAVLLFTVIAYYIVARKSSPSISQAMVRLARAFSGTEAVGIIRDEKTNTVDFVPLRRVEGFWVSADPRRPVIIVPNPHARTPIFARAGKPVVFAVTHGDVTGIEEDIDGFMAALGFASLSVKGLDSMTAEANPAKAAEEAIREIMRRAGEAVGGELEVNPRTVIAFQIKKPAIIRGVIKNILQNINTAHMHLIGAANAIDKMSVLLKKLELEVKEAKMSKTATIILVVGMIVIIALTIYGALFHR